MEGVCGGCYELKVKVKENVLKQVSGLCLV